MRWFIARIRKLGGWISRLPAPVKVGLGAFLLIIVVGGGWVSYRAYSYIQSDPEFCRQCHIMEEAWEKWSTSEHSKVNCHSCHQTSFVQGARFVIITALQDKESVTTHATIPNDICQKCHYSGNPQWLQVANTAGHKAHVEANSINCQTCHGITLHRFRPPSEICANCHADHVAGQEKAIKVEQMREMHCTECHQYLRENSPLRPTRETCLGCHQDIPSSKVTFPDSAPMKWDCRECHKPHVAEKPVVDCTSCHTDVKSKGAHAKQTHSVTSCQTCHKPHEWKLGTRDTCTACHTNKTDHNPGRLCSGCHDFKSLPTD